MAKPTRMSPEAMLMPRKALSFSLPRTAVITPVKINHHKAEPRKTPDTSINPEPALFVCVPKPKPAKTAVKESMVMGLERVRKRVDA